MPDPAVPHPDAAPHPDADPHPDDPRAGTRRSEGPGRVEGEPEVLPAAVTARPRPGAQLVTRRRGAVPALRDTVARLARNPVAVTTALVGAGLAVRLAPAVLGREVLRAAPATLPVRPAPVEPAVVRHVVHHVVHVVVHVRPSPPPGIL